MKGNASRPVAVVLRSALAVSLFSLVVPALLQGAPHRNSHTRHAASSDSVQLSAFRRRVRFGATEALRNSADEKFAAVRAIELTRALETGYRSSNTMMALTDELPGFQHRRITVGSSFALQTAHNWAAQEWVYPTTCDVRGWIVARPQTRSRAVVLLGYSDHTCAGGWKRLPLAVHRQSQLDSDVDTASPKVISGTRSRGS
jgi:hypothetical protein